MKTPLNDNTAIALAVGLALGLSIVAIILYLKKTEQTSETGVTYIYDNEGRLVSILPATKNTQFVRLKQAG